MSKYFEIPCHNIISSYGGIGSLVETPKGSLIILPLEKWPFFIYEVDGKDKEHLESLSVIDPRLVHRLNHVFKDLSYLLSIPINSASHGGFRVQIENNLIAAEYFPNWMFCPRCLRFMKYEDWLIRYRFAHIGKNFDLFCPDCIKPAHGRKAARILLEQVRFIRVSCDGEIEDYPWEEWFEQRANAPQKCDKHEFYYKTSPYSDNLESIRIFCKRCNASASLLGIFGNKLKVENFRTVLKSSNSVYFPAIVRSLMIPVSKRTKSLQENSEMEYRCQELEYMVDKANARDFDAEEKIHLKPIPLKNSSLSLISIRTLSMVSVLCSYSRLQPIAFGSVFDHNRSKHVTQAGLKTKFLPCVQYSGEGFLMVFHDSIIKQWYNTIVDNSEFSARMDAHKEDLSKFNPMGDSINFEYALYKYVLLHTISHLLIKQLEYTCGYPASSLNERIYASGGTHAGLMVYTVAGSEGSYGGIVTITEKGDIVDLMHEAFEKARYCSNDPVCYSQRSICFSCGLLPETSCEAFNTLLDRSLIVDKTYGFAQMI